MNQLTGLSAFRARALVQAAGPRASSPNEDERVAI
jgi:hypothetical protein